MRFTTTLQILVRRRGQRQLAELMFCERLPDRYDAEINLVRFLANCFDSCWSKAPVVRDVPKKDVRIEQEPHFPSNCSSTSSGSGESKSSGTTNSPLASPIGRSPAISL